MEAVRSSAEVQSGRCEHVARGKETPSRCYVEVASLQLETPPIDSLASDRWPVRCR